LSYRPPYFAASANYMPPLGHSTTTWSHGEAGGSGRTGSTWKARADRSCVACFSAYCSSAAYTRCTPTLPPRGSLFSPCSFPGSRLDIKKTDTQSVKGDNSIGRCPTANAPAPSRPGSAAAPSRRGTGATWYNHGRRARP